jgi:hypothetical protein
MVTLKTRQFAQYATVTPRTVKEAARSGTISRVSPGVYRASELAVFEYRRLGVRSKQIRFDAAGLRRLEQTFSAALLSDGFDPAAVAEETALYAERLRALNDKRGDYTVTVVKRHSTAAG